MRRNEIGFLVFCVGLLLVLNVPGISSAAGAYPEKSVQMIVPYGPGGITDQIARIVAQDVSAYFNEPVVVVNKPGGGGIVGTSEALRSRPDGYRVMMNVAGPTTTALAVAPDIPYAWDDLTAIAQISFSAIVFCVKSDSKWQTVQEMLDDVRKNPEDYKYGAGAVGSPVVFALAQLFESAGIDPNSLTRVVFGGGAATTTALAGGHVDFACINTIGALSLIKAGKLRGLVVTSPERDSVLPDVPTGREAGYPAFGMSNWAGVIGPKNLPAEVVNAWNLAIKNAMKNEKFLSSLKRIAATPHYADSKAYMKLMKETYEAAVYYVEKLNLRQVTK